MSKQTILDVVVAGGGLSGLAGASAIRRAAPATRIVVLEAREDAGGCIRSIRRDGFLIEAGPAGFLDKTGSVRRLADHLGVGDDVLASDMADRTRWVVRNGKLRQFPSSMASFLRSDLLTIRGKLRMLTEPLRPFRHESEGDETVHEFASRRLGEEAAKLLVDPIVSGIYGADATQVSVQASLPQFSMLEKKRRSLLMSFLRGSGKPARLGSFRGGCGQLIDALERSLTDSDVSIEYNSPIDAVVSAPHGYTVFVGGATPRTLHCRAFLSAAPASAASRYLSRTSSEIAMRLSGVRYCSIAVVALGYRNSDVTNPMRGYGYLVPSSEDSQVLGGHWSSTIYPGERAPVGSCLARMFIGGAHYPTAVRESDDVLTSIATTELGKVLGISAPPVVSHVVRHIDAMPQYLIDHRLRVAEIEEALHAHPGLFLGGNGLRGTGMDALAKDAETQGQAVAHYVLDRSVAASGRTLASTSPINDGARVVDQIGPPLVRVL